MKEKKKVNDPKRNNIFAAALAILRQVEGQNLEQQKLAERMGVNKNTITRIITQQTTVTENMISKFQEATGNIFNIQWLRGESDVIFAADMERQINPHQSTKDAFETVESLKCKLADRDARLEEKEARIADMKDRIKDLKQQVADQRQQISDLRSMLNLKRGQMPVPQSKVKSKGHTSDTPTTRV